MNKLIGLLVVAGLVVLASPRLLNANHPPVRPPAAISGNAPEEPTFELHRVPLDTAPSTTRSSVVSTVTSTTTMAVPTTVVPVDTQEVVFPVTQVLPFETLRWRIDYRIDPGPRLILVITLMTLTNRADQVDERRAQLVQAKAEALAWLMERGGTKPSAYPITWLPAEAATL